jgi:hypothetical protein
MAAQQQQGIKMPNTNARNMYGLSENCLPLSHTDATSGRLTASPAVRHGPCHDL